MNNIDFWAELEEIVCLCQGSGWANVNEDWHECPIHFQGQLHPDCRNLLLDDPEQLAETERKSILIWKLEKSKAELNKLQVAAKQLQHSIQLMELELVNKTPTSKIEAVKLPANCYPTVQIKAVRL